MSTSLSPTAPGDPAQHAPQSMGRLPRPLTPLFGREDDVRAVSTLLATDGVQIVTLLGPGGVGKTRLAIAVAAQAGADYPDGVRFAGLASVCDAALMPAAIAQALGIRDQPGTPFIDCVESMAREWRLLLVVDNLEHLLDTAPVLGRIAERCPGIRLLCTSRARLSISGEHAYVTPPLAPDAAVALFTQRASMVAPGLLDAPDTPAIVAEVCNRLDRLPLAIELAAARVPVLSPRDLLQGVHDRFAVLAQGLQDMPDRHRDLRTAISWSYDLLDQEDQRVFRSLAVFSGGFTLEAAREVLGDCSAVLESMARLESSSLVLRLTGHEDGSRFSMLETIRQFAWERLVDGGELEQRRLAHAAHVVQAFDGTDRLWWMPEGMERLNLIEEEIGNLRAALSFLKEAGEIEDFLRLAGAVAALWASRGYSHEGRSHLEWGLSQDGDVSPEVVVVATWALSWILNQHDEGYRAMVTGQYALSIATPMADPVRTVSSLMITGVGAYRYGQLERSLTYFQEIVGICETHCNEAWTRIAQCIAMNQLGVVTLHLGHVDLAESWYSQALGFQRHLTFTHGAHSLMGLGEVARARGDAQQALAMYQAALPIMQDARDIRSRAYVIAAIAGTVATIGQHELAAKLFGASEVEHERIAFAFASHTWERQRAFGLPEPWAARGVRYGIHETLFHSLDQQSAAVRATHLDPEVSRIRWTEGRAMAFEEAISLALAATVASHASPALPGELSPREIEVVTLLARGLSDEEIAQRLSISRRTASNHAHHIYTKLDLESRAEATAWAIKQGLA